MPAEVIQPAIVVEGLTKSFRQVRALQGIDLAVPSGTILGVLGPNGAGKTTTVRILTTLLPPDGGRAEVNGFDVVRQPAEVRRSIGLAGQSSSVLEALTGRENLEFMGRLFHLGKAPARRRAAELLDQFDLAESADRLAKTYSGGMRRRLDLAASLMRQPAVLFLDEPTAGLDPRSRQALWDTIRALRASGTTLLLTTQYLEEADELADEVVVIDRGAVIAAGTAEQLKSRIGGDVVEFTVPDRARLGEAVGAVKANGEGEPVVDTGSGLVSLRVGGRGSEALVDAVRDLDGAGIRISGLVLRRPSLDDVFLALTGRPADDGTTEAAPVGKGRRARGPKASGHHNPAR